MQISEQTTSVMNSRKMVNPFTSIVKFSHLLPQIGSKNYFLKKKKSVDPIGLDKQNFSA